MPMPMPMPMLTCRCRDLQMAFKLSINTFPFSKQSNSDLSPLNFGFHNFEFSSDTNIFSDEGLKLIFTEWNYMETPFSDSDHPVAIGSKFYDINDFNKLKINENFSLSTLHLNITSLPKHSEDLHNFLSL